LRKTLLRDYEDLLTDAAQATPFDWPIALGIAALTVAVIAIPIAVSATRRWGNRRSALAYTSEWISLLPVDLNAGAFQLTLNKVPVPEPHLLTISLTNIGPKDIATAMFDSGRPIRIQLGGRLYGVTSTQGGVLLSGFPSKESGDVDTINVLPSLLPRGAAWSFSAVVSGTPSVEFDWSLIDTDYRAGTRDEVVREALLSALDSGPYLLGTLARRGLGG
jgi:hypothetical protein